MTLIRSSSGKAFASPRSWAFLSGILDANPDPDVEYELFRGTVGDGAAAEFMGFLRVWRGLPSVEDILANPADALVPDDPAALYAVCEALSEKAADGTVNALVTYAGRLPSEFGVLLMRDAVCRRRAHCPHIRLCRLGSSQRPCIDVTL